MGHSYISGQSVVEIYSTARAAIEAGTIIAGAPLPSVRALADELSVNRNTVASAYRRLATAGLVEGNRRGLRVVGKDESAPIFDALDFGAAVRDLSFGNPNPEYLPPLGEALASAALRPPPLYGAEAELPELLELAARRACADGLPSEDGTVMLSSGALDGIERVLAAHLAPGDVVAIEVPCFTRLLHLFRSMGLNVFGVPIDEAGALPEGIAAAIRAKARAFVLTPLAHNPTGATLTPERAVELRIALDRAPETLLVEDDHFSRLSRRPYSTLVTPARRRWAVLRSVSKQFGPDLRFAYLHADPITIARVRARQSVGTAWVSQVLQAAVLHLEQDPAVEALLARAGREYDQRRSALLSALAKQEIGGSAAEGFNIWTPTLHEGEVARRLLARGWAVRTGEAFRVAGRGGSGLRITVSTLPPDQAPALAQAMAEALRPTTRTAAG